MLPAGSLVELRVEKPVVGGRMLARANGEVVLVYGAIPGEVVRATIERRQQGVTFATTSEVLDPSPDRRDPGLDPACGGMSFAHIAYERQCRLKGEIVGDALARIAHIALDRPVEVTPSPPHGYRARYRVHPGPRGLGFYREGSHDVCNPQASNQLAEATLDVLQAIAARLPVDAGTRVQALECMENLPNTQRAVNLVMRGDARPDRVLVDAIAGAAGVSGLSWVDARTGSLVAATGDPGVADPVAAFLPAVSANPAAGQSALLTRRAASFFQANRFIAPVLAQKVAALVGEVAVIDLYAGVGLFAVTLAALGRTAITAIEGDRFSAQDLQKNAAPFAGQLHVEQASVEKFLAGNRVPSDGILIVDPPRTGMSRVAMEGILQTRARRLVYVSCDVATLARDARRLVDRAYVLSHVEAIDMFPNTAHVEVLATFDIAATGS